MKIERLTTIEVQMHPEVHPTDVEGLGGILSLYGGGYIGHRDDDAVYAAPAHRLSADEAEALVALFEAAPCVVAVEAVAEAVALEPQTALDKTTMRDRPVYASAANGEVIYVAADQV